MASVSLNIPELKLTGNQPSVCRGCRIAKGLVAALILQMFVTFLKKWEEDFLDACADYCLRNIVGRLRIMPYQQEGE